MSRILTPISASPTCTPDLKRAPILCVRGTRITRLQHQAHHASWPTSALAAAGADREWHEKAGLVCSLLALPHLPGPESPVWQPDVTDPTNSHVETCQCYTHPLSVHGRQGTMTHSCLSCHAPHQQLSPATLHAGEVNLSLIIYTR